MVCLSEEVGNNLALNVFSFIRWRITHFYRGRMELAYEIVEELEDYTRIRLIGPKETTEFPISGLPPRVKTDCTLDLSQVGFLNSHLLVDWSRFIKELTADRHVVIEQCPSEVLYFFCLCPELLVNCQIESFTCNYYCDDCGADFSTLVRVPKNTGDIAKLETTPCVNCKSAAEVEMPVEGLRTFLDKE